MDSGPDNGGKSNMLPEAMEIRSDNAGESERLPETTDSGVRENAELTKLLTLVKTMPIATGVSLKRLSNAEVIRYTRPQNVEKSYSNATTSENRNGTVKNSGSQSELARKRLEKTKKMAEVLQRANNANGVKNSYNFSYAAKTSSNTNGDQQNMNGCSAFKGAKRSLETTDNKEQNSFNVNDLLSNSIWEKKPESPEESQPPFKIPKRKPGPASRTLPSASATAPAPSTSTSKPAAAAGGAENNADPDPPPQPVASSCTNGSVPQPSSVDISEDFSYAVPLAAHLKKREICWFCPICDHYDDKEEHSMRCVENHIRESHLRCFLDVPSKDCVCFLCEVDMKNARSLLAHWIKMHIRHFEDVLALNCYSKRFLSPLPYDRSQCTLKVKCLRCGTTFTDMRFYWVHLAVEHYAEMVVPTQELEDNAATATPCYFPDCANKFKTRTAIIAHMAAAHELMQKFFGTIVQNDLYLEVNGTETVKSFMKKP